MDLSNASDWIWLAVVAFWLLARVLPRLFRRGRQSAATRQPQPPTRQAQQPQQPPTRPQVEPTPTERARFEPTAAERLRRGDGPKPIEPR